MTSRRAVAGWGALFTLLCLATLTLGVESAVHFNGPAIDGPFQLYNALRRIAAGQRVGVDFEFFHGALVPYLHYPIFRLFGGGFFASEITRQVLSALLYPATVLIVLKSFLRTWAKALAWAAAVMALSIGLRMTSVVIAVNSLLGIRSTLPVLFPVVLCLPLRRSLRLTLSALTLGGAFLLGTEQGIALAAAIVLVTAVVATESNARGIWIEDAAVIVAGGVATLVVVLIMLGGVAGMRGAIGYNFKLVPMDQYWYFGAPPNPFVSSWSQLVSLLVTRPRIAWTLLIGAVGAVFYLVRARRDANSLIERRTAALAILLLYGCISTASLLGSWEPVYVQPLMRVLLLSAAVGAAEWSQRRGVSSAGASLRGVARTGALIIGACIVAMIALVPPIIGTICSTLPHMIASHVIRREPPAFAGLWPESMAKAQAVLDANRGVDGRPPTLWSTYAGLLEARNGLFNPNVDYIIHALGPDARARYVREFEVLRPEIVQTVRPSYTPYEWWIESTSWEFYASLLRDYDVAGDTPWSLLWKRHAPGEPQSGVWTQAIPDGNASARLPVASGDSIALLDVQLDYHVTNPLHALPIIGSMPRYLVSISSGVTKDPVTLDPYTTTARFPVVVRAGVIPEIRWATFGLLPGASITVDHVRVRMIPLRGSNLLWLNELASH